MLAWFIRLFAHSCPTRREMMATRDACDGLEARVDQVYDELKQLRGKVNAIRRHEKDADDAPSEPNGDGEAVQGGGPRGLLPAMRALRRW